MAVDDLRSGTWVTYVGGRATSARLRRCRVEVVTGADAGLVRDIESSVIRIGARRGNDIQLTDSKVSGLHYSSQVAWQLSVQLLTRRVADMRLGHGLALPRLLPPLGRFSEAGWFSMLRGDGHSLSISLLPRL